jgi:hypothetical protein
MRWLLPMWLYNHIQYQNAYGTNKRIIMLALLVLRDAMPAFFRRTHTRRHVHAAIQAARNFVHCRLHFVSIAICRASFILP